MSDGTPILRADALDDDLQLEENPCVAMAAGIPGPEKTPVAVERPGGGWDIIHQ